MHHDAVRAEGLRTSVRGLNRWLVENRPALGKGTRVPFLARVRLVMAYYSWAEPFSPGIVAPLPDQPDRTIATPGGVTTRLLTPRSRHPTCIRILNGESPLAYRTSMSDLFEALAAPARRAILDELCKRDGQTLSRISHRLTMKHDLAITRQAVSQHLDVLGRAGLVSTNGKGVTSITTSTRRRWRRLRNAG